MAWKGRTPGVVDFKDILNTLNAAKLQSENPMLYQTLKQLIDRAQQVVERQTSIFQSIVGDITIDDSDNLPAILNSITTINAILAGSQFLVSADESNNLPNSRQLIAGANILFDDTVANVRTISSTGGGGSGSYIPLSLGIEPLTFVSDGLGQPMLIPFVA